jgi:hypothetical protein
MFMSLRKLTPSAGTDAALGATDFSSTSSVENLTIGVVTEAVNTISNLYEVQVISSANASGGSPDRITSILVSYEATSPTEHM